MQNAPESPFPGRDGKPAGRRLRARAERGACCGYGLCTEICPQVFKLDDNGFVVLAVAVIPVELETQAREGAAACPQSALTIEEI